MDLSAYLLNGVVEATAPPNETAADARSRGDAIIEMVRAFDPRDAMETMIACHCVMLQYLLNSAVLDAGNVNLEAAVLIKARAGAVSISRTLHQWVTKIEKVKKRNEASAAETRLAAQKSEAPVSAVEVEPVEAVLPDKSPSGAPGTQPPQPIASVADRPAVHVQMPAPKQRDAPVIGSGVTLAPVTGSPSHKSAGSKDHRRLVA